MSAALLPPLTAKHRAILDFIVGYLRDHGRPPTYREIMPAFGYGNTNAVRSHLTPLARKGYIRIDPKAARGIVVNQYGGVCPCCGRLARDRTSEPNA